MINVELFLLVASLILTIVAGIGRAPLWPAVLLVVVVALLHTTWPH
jgi:hypothetical protein